MPYKSPTMLLAVAASGDAAALAAALGSAAPAALAEKSSDGFSLLHIAVGLKSASTRGATVRACTLALPCHPPPPRGLISTNQIIHWGVHYSGVYRPCNVQARRPPPNTRVFFNIKKTASL